MDGFSFDAWAGGKDALDLLDLMFKICEKKKYPFELTITLDTSCQDPQMEGVKSYTGSAVVKSIKWLLDKHGKSPNLARRDGKPLILGYQSLWTCYGLIYDVARKHVGPNASREKLDAEANRMLVCEEGWKLMAERYRHINAEVGQPIYWEFDFGGTDGGLIPGGVRLPAAKKDLLLGAERVVAAELPSAAFGAFLGTAADSRGSKRRPSSAPAGSGPIPCSSSTRIMAGFKSRLGAPTRCGNTGRRRETSPPP